LPPEASVIIPTYNKLGCLRKTLGSLLRQGFGGERFEVIVVDDGSSDGTAEFLGAFGPDLNLRCIRHGRNRGRAAARNSGLAEARGRVIIFLDDDMIASPSLVELHVRSHDRSGTVTIGNVLPADEVPRDSINRYLHTRGVHKLKGGDRVPFWYFVTNNSSVERGDLLEAGPFDERIRGWGGEDLELGCRLKDMGLSFTYCREAISYHMHPRSIGEVCALSRSFGMESVPLIIGEHPELREVLHLDFDRIEGPDPLRVKLGKLALRAVMNSAVYIPVRGISELLNGIYVPDILFDYLILYNRYLGFRKGALRKSYLR